MHFPAGIPLALGFSTNMGVSESILMLRHTYFVSPGEITVETIRREHVWLRDEDVIKRIGVKDFSCEGVRRRKLELTFFKNRLMSLLFVPALSEEECKVVLGDSYSLLLTDWRNLGCKGVPRENCKEDKIQFVDWRSGSGIYSMLLWNEYADWCWHKGL
jgi:hypothetical protein